MRYRVSAKHVFGKISKTYRTKASAKKHANQMRKGIGFSKVRIRKIK